MIRDINLNDINSIYRLGKEYNKNFEKQYDLKYYINNNIYIMKCYCDDNIIKGFIISTKLYENLEILLVYVDTEYRKNGVATKLLNSIENLDIKNILLEVSVENEAAINLYKKNGFIIDGIRKGYYHGVDAYIMKKVL